MSSHLDAAFHHAGHAVTAHLSRFHCLALPLRTDVFGTGEVTAALSRRKLMAAAKVASAESRTDPDVVTSIVLILCAGLASEQLASEHGFEVTPDPGRSKGDFEVAREELVLAGMADAVPLYCERASALLRENWAHVETVAEMLAMHGELSPDDIAAIIDDPDSALQADG